MPDGEIPSTGGIGDLNSLLELFKGIFGSGTNSDTNQNSPTALAGIQTLLPMLLQNLTSGDFSRESAIKDSQGEVDDIIKQLKDSGIPLISQQQNNAGAYNSTTASLLANDLASRAAGQGALAQGKTIDAYARLQQNKVTQLIALINSAVGAERNTITRNQTPGLKDNVAARNTALAGLLAGLLGKGNGKPSSGGAKPNGNSNKNPAARRPGDNSPTGAGTQATDDNPTAGLPGAEGDTPGTSDGDAADRAAQDEQFPQDFTPLDAGGDIGSLLDTSSVDFMSDIADNGGLPDLLDGSDLLFFGDDGSTTDAFDPGNTTDGIDLGDPFDLGDNAADVGDVSDPFGGGYDPGE